ncbi:MAG: hypothetical protein NTW52_19965 [Planctomycetota bacterium]|nr:hypothetical protein [Planctomycetota bacterium]
MKHKRPYQPSLTSKAEIMRLPLALCGIGFVFSFATSNVFSQDELVKPSVKEQSTSQAIPQVSVQKPISYWMEAKLGYSKAILEDLTKGDFEKLADEAQQMRLIGKMEGFVRRKNESYRNQLSAFDIANQELIRQAKLGSAEGAALAFNQLTTSCVSCHVLLRAGVE